MLNPIFVPRRLEEFRRTIQQSEIRTALTLRWNDLSREGKEKLAIQIKKWSKSEILRTSEKASIENIILALDITNPILEQTRGGRYRNSWAFSSAYIASCFGLKIISSVIIITLRLRKKVKFERIRDYYIAIGGWNNYRAIIDGHFMEDTADQLTTPTPRDPFQSEIPSDLTREITLEEVSAANRN